MTKVIKGCAINIAAAGLVLLASTGATIAQGAAFCDASQKLLDRVHEKLADWAVPEEIDRLGMIRIMTRASLARSYATDEGLDETLVAALNVLVIARDNDDPMRLPDDEVPAAIYDNIQTVAGYMPDLCPDVDVPDFSAFAHFSPE